MASQYKYLTPGGLPAEEILASLDDSFDLEAGPLEGASFTLHDTFDWRLYRSGYWLETSGRRLTLRRVETDEIAEQAQINGRPAFAWDLPEGGLKKAISSSLFVRALIPLARARVASRTYRVLDDERKTVVRLELGTVRIGSSRSKKNRVGLAVIHPLRGYFRQARQLSKALQAFGLAGAGTSDLYLFILGAAGKTPGDYDPKPRYSLSPEMRSDEAARIILRHLLDVIRANEAGLREDIDTEFLHDYRVAIRRTRSALGQIKGVFPIREVARFKSDFAYLGNLTNPLRDLDVYLLKEPAYRDMLPEDLREDIDPLFAYLKRKRKAAHRTVVRGLKTKKYLEILSAWEEFLGPPKPLSAAEGTPGDTQLEMDLSFNPEVPKASSSVVELAKSRIRKRYALVVKSGEQILETQQDEALHRLRIECKKLRYLLEFFYSLFPPEPMDQLIKQLKTLQDNLGDFNDLAVQQEYLLSVSRELPHRSEKSVRSLLAIGALVGELDARQRVVKGAFSGTFAEFASPENQALFKQLFGKGSA